MRSAAYDPAALDDLIDRAFALDELYPHFANVVEEDDVEFEPRDLGGPGSGNFGHAGRPGKVGGSAKTSHAELTQYMKDAKASHTQFEKDHGPDKDWAGWYADFVSKKMGGEISPATLRRLITDASKVHTGEDWPEKYAEHILKNAPPDFDESDDARPWIGRPSSAYPPSLATGRDTRERFSDGHGNYTPERAKLHDEIIDKMIRGPLVYKDGPKIGQPRPAPVPVDHPTATILGGAPGVGKSTIVAKLGIGYENTVTISVDNIRDELPEFAKDPVTGKQPDDISFTHEEASDISAKMIRKLGKEGYNMVLDGTGDSTIEKLGGKVAVMRSKGAKIVADYVTTTIGITQQRADVRGEKIGRKVPPSVTVAMHKAVGKILPEAVKQGLFDEFRLWDSSKREPVLVAEGRRRQMKIYEHELYDAYLKRGHVID